MAIDLLALSAALLSGLLGGVHCAAMCGGIATGFSMWSPRHGLLASLQLNVGRVLGYVLAGALVGGSR
ncbi:sulfite exporter TauE/SafE family protein [Dyella terrae]|uniref:urease accessory protein UreH domain-containing protein n=1 Tax=Dyella terrae TaxID=522259 RepID=UPI0023D950C6|nr:sulfite exporter TauE/SafE family protein [Dyella terrae]ULU26890.1 sulfite exporter TauE/SafE family protein [Dyella terrae]